MRLQLAVALLAALAVVLLAPGVLLASIDWSALLVRVLGYKPEATWKLSYYGRSAAPPAALIGAACALLVGTLLRSPGRPPGEPPRRLRGPRRPPLDRLAADRCQ
jgi:hypothetical protein